jgi:hypothetical protein
MFCWNQKEALPNEALPSGKSSNVAGTILHLFGKIQMFPK